MLNKQFDIKRIHMLKDILIRLRHEEREKNVQEDILQYFKEVSVPEVLLIEQVLINGDYGITIGDVKKLSSIHPHLYIEAIDEADLATIDHPGHPVQIIKQENKDFQSNINQINYLLESFEKDPEHFQATDMMDILKQQVSHLGEFHKHYHRKEKLIFPMMERYGYFDPTRMMWRGDDRIRALYKGTKRLIDQLPHIDLKHVQVTFSTFTKAFHAMIFQEEAILLPILLSIFDQEDWLVIAEQSDAFGYAFQEPKEKWQPTTQENLSIKADIECHLVKDIAATENIRFGGGYLTIEEANLIFNNLPLEITFVDKNSMFKYFNEITAASKMMLVRTPVSIGRNVANCHPPKSLQKVMTIIRDLKTKKRTSESMWYKKDDQYIFITYKALFNNKDEFLGILEYVQDIQPFFDLPSEIKTNIHKF